MLKPALATTVLFSTFLKNRRWQSAPIRWWRASIFLPDIDPADLAYKALAVNVSDLAAMGADPAWLTLALTLPEVDEAWLEAFSDSLFEQLSYYDMQLIGGDTTARAAVDDAGHSWLCAGRPRAEALGR